MRTLAAILALALAGAALPAAVQAAAPPRAEAYQCNALAAEIGPANVWSAWFRGSKRGLFDDVDTYQTTACFHTEANCKAWLYWAQTDWPYMNTFRPCAKSSG